MEINFWFVGIGVALSIAAFFLKRMKEEITNAQERLSRQEKHIVQLKTNVEQMQKLLEDRRQDIKELFKQCSRS